MRAVAGNASILVGGVLLGLSFPPSPSPFLALIAMLPILAAWTGNADGWIVLRKGFLFYGVCFGTAFYWPLTHIMWPAALSSLAPIFGLSLVFAAPLAATARVHRRFGYLAGCASLIAAHLLMEAALSYGPLAMPWPLLGNVMADQPQVRQLASLSGVAGISLWILTINLLVLGLFAEGTRRITIGIAAAAWLAGGVFGGMALLPRGTQVDQLRVAIVQPALEPRAWADVDSHIRTRVLSELTDSMLSASADVPEIVIWPETALPPCHRSVLCGESDSLVRQHVGRWNVPLLTGAIIHGNESGALDLRSATYFNSALLFTAHPFPQRYDKIRLVPFAEYVPLSETLSGLSNLAVPAGGVSGYKKGERHGVFKIERRRIGVLICFESAFGRATRNLANLPTDFIVVLSQNGWWAANAAHRQHLAFTRLRAVETGNVVVFASASGSSAVIDVDGSIARSAPYMARTAFLATVPVRNARPVYLVWGDWVTPLSVLLALVVLGHIALRRRSRPDDPKAGTRVSRDEHAAV